MSSTTPNEVKSYPAYKESNVEWLGNVPEHWEVRRIKSLSIVRRGASPRPIDDSRYFDEHGEFAWVRISDVTASDRYLYKTTQRLSELGQSLSVELKPGSLFLSIAGSVGKPIITKIKCCIHDGFVYFPRFRGDVEFLYRVLSTDVPFSGLGKFGTQLNLNTDTVGNICVGWPPSDEQAAIVRYLDDADQRIRAYVSAKERLIALLEEERQATIHQAVTRGLDPNVKLKPSGVEWLGDVPEHWEVRRIRTLGQAVIGLTYSPQDMVDKEEGRLVLRASNISGGQIVDADNVYVRSPVPDKLILREGDILICSRSGSRNLIGKNARIANTSLGVTFGAFMTILRGPNNDYLHQVFNSKLFEYQSGAFLTSTINQLTLGILNDMKIPFPPAGEQQSILQYLNEATQTVDATIDRARRQIELMEEYRTRLIADVVTGKIDVRTKTPTQK